MTASTTTSRSSAARSARRRAGAEVDADAADATYEDGILTVELPLRAARTFADGPDPRDRTLSAVEGEFPEGLPDKLPVFPRCDWSPTPTR